jgi:hypothetical protein
VLAFLQCDVRVADAAQQSLFDLLCAQVTTSPSNR